jgi:hypothetical protein
MSSHRGVPADPLLENLPLRFFVNRPVSFVFGTFVALAATVGRSDEAKSWIGRVADGEVGPHRGALVV